MEEAEIYDRDEMNLVYALIMRVFFSVTGWRSIGEFESRIAWRLLYVEAASILCRIQLCNT